MKRTDANASPVYTVIQTIKGSKGTFKRTATFTDEYDAQQYAWTCVNLLNASWAEVHAPNGERISLHVAA
jgi:hypothetical protein